MRGLLVVFTGPASPDVESAYNDWYTGCHLPDVLAIPGYTAATRYHSLVIERESLPASLEITAWTDDGEIMGVRHREKPVEGVQFHPESILTEAGHDLLRNFLKRQPASSYGNPGSDAVPIASRRS